MATTQGPQDRGITAFRNVFSFAVVAHVADIITTHWRCASLADEGNPIYQALLRFGLGGWSALIGIKLVGLAVMGFAYSWYLRVRRQYVPRQRIDSLRALIWYSMWEGREYPKSPWRRIFDARELQFGAMIMSAIALPASAVAAMYYSLDNVFWAINRPLPPFAMPAFVMIVTPTMFVWWCLAYRQYCEEHRQEGLAPDAEATEG